MGDINKLPIQHRTCQIRAEDIDADGRKVKLSFSSETPVERFYGNEILSHEKGHVRLERINTKAPLLYNHDPADQIGVVESATIKDGRGEAVVRLSRSARGEEMLQDIKDGIRSNISVGYRIYDMAEEKRGKGEPSDFRVIEWEPLEISVVPIPADTSVGVGRSQNEPAFAVRVQYAENQEPAGAAAGGEGTGDNQPKTQSRIMEQPPAPAKAPEINVGEIRQKEREQERARVREISAIGEKFKLREAAEKAIESGDSIDSFRKLAMEKIGEGWGSSPTEGIDPKAAQRFGSEIGLSKKEAKRFDFLKALRQVANGRPIDGFEGEVTKATAERYNLDPNAGLHLPADIVNKRALEAGVAEEGGYLVGDQFVGGPIEYLYNRMVAGDRVTKISGLVGRVPIPKVSGSATSYWVAEEGSIGESDPSFGNVVMDAKRLGTRVVVSDQLLTQKSFSVESLVQMDIQRSRALKLDAAIFNGSGSGSEPTGIVNTPNVNTITYGGAQTWADYVNMWSAIASDNADVANMAYVMNAASIAKGLTIEKASNTAQFLIGGNPNAGFSSLIFPVLPTEQVPSNKAFFGNWADCIVGTWGAISIIRDQYTKAQTGQVVFNVSGFHDIGIRHAESFCVSTDSAIQ